MASEISVRDSWTFVSTLLKNQQLNVNNLQPGLTMANIVLQRMLGAPFVWRFNRGTFNIPIAPGSGTDYMVTVADLGRIEKQWMTDSSGNIIALKGAVALEASSSERMPVEVAPQYDDNVGDITLRFNSVPDQAYTAYFDYQRKAPLLTSPASTFAPVPDEFGYLFNTGMLAQGALLINDSRFQIWQSDFAFGILATQDGLDEQAKQMFYDQMMNTSRTVTRSQMSGQMGSQGRQR